MTSALDIVTCAVVAAVLGPLGVWGRSHAHELVPGNLAEGERQHRVSVLRRGGLAAQFAAALFLLACIGLIVT